MYWFIGFVGFLLVFAPFQFGYRDNLIATWSSISLGIIAIVLSLLEAVSFDEERWEYLVVGGVGLMAVAAPYLLEYHEVSLPTWTSIFAGVLLMSFGASELYSGKR